MSYSYEAYPADQQFLEYIQGENLKKVREWLDDKRHLVSPEHTKAIAEIYKTQQLESGQQIENSNTAYILYEVCLAVQRGQIAGSVDDEMRKTMESKAGALIARFDSMEEDQLVLAIQHQDADKIKDLLKDPAIKISRKHMDAIEASGGDRRICMYPIIHAFAEAIVEGKCVPKESQRIASDILEKLAYLQDRREELGKDFLKAIGTLAQKLVNMGATLRRSTIDLMLKSHEKLSNMDSAQKEAIVELDATLKQSNLNVLYEEMKGHVADHQDYEFKLFCVQQKPNLVDALKLAFEKACDDYKNAPKESSLLSRLGYYANHMFTGINIENVEKLLSKISELKGRYDDGVQRNDIHQMETAESDIMKLFYNHLNRKAGLSAHLDPLDDNAFDTFLLKAVQENSFLSDRCNLNSGGFKLQFQVLSKIDETIRGLQNYAPSLAAIALIAFRGLVGDYSGENLVNSRRGREWMRDSAIEKIGDDLLRQSNASSDFIQKAL